MSHLVEIKQELINQYNEAHVAEKDYILRSLSENNWEKQKEEGNITLYSRSVPGSSFIETKTVILVDAPAQAMIDTMTYDKVFSLEETPQGPIPPEEIYALYDPKDENQSIIYFMAMKSPAFLVAPREMLLYRRTYFEGGKTIFMQMSIDNEDLKPQRKSHVRTIISGQAFVIEADPENKERCIMTVFSHVNPGGSLPAWAVNYSVKNQLDGVKTITGEAVKYYQRTKNNE
ncbi:phosphatidylcholine transfer protein-like [Histomonas meleagridis]|uniref:phosphatidylcholine transfer protein-like n=1 Tax=Histomonas meleagridis TaxID=135588 RepID=UPI00355AC352|nr:phosphatidylcholine transfer protein-like [Histomonas meleagridis]KAH0803373.1 phosphatidylcholine transfer protein-like [Histomonas meleagridis]